MRIERLSQKDKQSLKYMLQNNTKTPVNQKSETGEIEYIEIDGEMIPVETGIYDIGQGEESEEEVTDYIVCFDGNIAFSSGEVEMREFGVDSGDYDSVLIMPKDSIPITETSLIWHESEPKYIDGSLVDFDGAFTVVKGLTGKRFEINKRVDTSSADYHVVKVIPSGGIKRYLLKKVVH
jgi:hypothetical protein